MDKKRLTAENGRPIADNQNVQTAGQREMLKFCRINKKYYLC